VIAGSPPRRSRGATWIAVCSVALLVAVVVGVAIRTVNTLEIPGRPELPRYGMQDFRDAIYYPIRTLLEGGNPYSPSDLRGRYATYTVLPLISPLTFIVHLPFAFMSQRTGEAVHFALSTFLTVLLAYLCIRWAGVTPTVTDVAAFGAILVASRPGQTNIYFGQCAAYMVIATLAAFHYRRRRPGLAIPCMALATMKPTFGVPLAVFLLADGAVRVAIVGGLIGTAAGLLAGSVAVRNAGGLAPFVASLRDNLGEWTNFQEASGATGIYSVDAVALFDRIRDLPPVVEAIMSAAILGVGALAVARLRGRDSAALLAASVVSLTTLVFTHHQIYDALLVALPLVAFASGQVSTPAGPIGPWLRWGLVALLSVPLASYLGTYQAMTAFGITGAARLVAVSAAGAAVLMAWLAVVALAFGESSGKVALAERT
jgi:hypothetical protein